MKRKSNIEPQHAISTMDDRLRTERKQAAPATYDE